MKDPPINGLDIAELQHYVSALGQNSAPFRWTSRHSADIDAQIEAGQVLSVQVTYHPGWHASVAGMPRKVFPDGLGLMVVEPECTGRCTVRLSYDGGVEMRAARLLSWGALLGSLLWIAIGWRTKSLKPDA